MKLAISSSQYIESGQGVDLSIPIKAGKENVNAWYCSPVKIEPVVSDNFVGEVSLGGDVNFRNITINPHGNGTHTECVGHISEKKYTINQCLNDFHHLGKIISIQPKPFWNDEFQEEDLIIDKELIEQALDFWENEKVLVIRTLENSEQKKERQYSNTNPAYFTQEAIEFINELGVIHLMVDLPSVDREVDHGELISHKTFWNYPENPILEKTISELLYIPNHLEDGTVLIQIQIMSIENDASPSKIIAHRIYNNQ